MTPADDHARSRIRLLLAVIPVVLIVTALATFSLYLSTAFSGAPPASTQIAGYALGLLVTAGASVALIALSAKARHGVGRGIGILYLGLALVITAPPLVSVIADEVRRSYVASQPFTAEETAWAYAELETLATGFLEESAIGLAEVESPSPQPAVPGGGRQDCDTSNLKEGVRHETVRRLNLAKDDHGAAVQTIRSNWESLGYTVNDGDGDYARIWVEPRGFVEYASVQVVETSSGVENLFIKVSTRCVAR